MCNVYLCWHIFHLQQDFVQGLSILSRGSVEEKLRWTFSLYDINGDGFITREEMTDIVTAIYELMGRLPDECPEEEKIKGKVEQIFQVSAQTHSASSRFSFSFSSSCLSRPSSNSSCQSREMFALLMLIMQFQFALASNCRLIYSALCKSNYVFLCWPFRQPDTFNGHSHQAVYRIDLSPSLSVRLSGVRFACQSRIVISG